MATFHLYIRLPASRIWYTMIRIAYIAICWIRKEPRTGVASGVVTGKQQDYLLDQCIYTYVCTLDRTHPCLVFRITLRLIRALRIHRSVVIIAHHYFARCIDLRVHRNAAYDPNKASDMNTTQFRNARISGWLS